MLFECYWSICSVFCSDFSLFFSSFFVRIYDHKLNCSVRISYFSHENIFFESFEISLVDCADKLQRKRLWTMFFFFSFSWNNYNIFRRNFRCYFSQCRYSTKCLKSRVCGYFLLFYVYSVLAEVTGENIYSSFVSKSVKVVLSTKNKKKPLFVYFSRLCVMK